MEWLSARPELDAKLRETRYLYNTDPACKLKPWQRVVTVDDQTTLDQCMKATFQLYNFNTGETGPVTAQFRDATKDEIALWRKERDKAVEARTKENDADKLRNAPTVIVQQVAAAGK